MTKKIVFWHNIVLYVMFALVVASGLLYYAEDNAPVSDTFRYYGNLTTKATFTYPEEITSITFGWSERTDKPVTYINELWCAPLNSGKEKELVRIRVVNIDNFRFSNELPKVLKAAVEAEAVTTGQISLVARRTIREIHKETPYDTWSMDDVIPLESSDCYITAEVVTTTDKFGIEKRTKFKGHEFQYIIPFGTKEFEN